MAASFSLTPEYTTRSPLPFPGGKSRGAKLISSLIPDDVRELVSPFCGAASVELAAAGHGIEVYAYDLFPPISNFWRCLAADPGRVADEVKTMAGWGPTRFSQVREKRYYLSLDCHYRRAALLYWVHLSSFGALGFSGPPDRKHWRQRLTTGKIEQLRRFRMPPSFHSAERDWQSSLEKHRGVFAYLDPPYITPSRWAYGWQGDHHKNFNHFALREYLGNRDQWILSYGNVPAVRKLYEGFEMIVTGWQYSLAPNSARSKADNGDKELLIFSPDLAPPSSLAA